MKKVSVVPLVFAAVCYLALFPLASACGLIHPVCYAYAGTVLPLLFAPIYLLAAANCRSFGAASALNGFTLIVGLLMGEGNPPFIIGLIVLTGLAELIRCLCGTDTKNGVRRSFIPLAFSFYAYAAHWWTDTEGSLAAAVEEMPAGYADKMVPVIENTPLLVVMLILTVPAAILGIRLAEKAMKKQADKLK